MRRALILVLAVFVIAAEPKKPGKPNALARESSPYLLQHAHNPVNWLPWGPDAFARAKKEKKLVFLSIGYSSCHWCHVMEKESFQDESVAKALNESFICIKVDREERPDVDQIYMAALNAMGNPGGWPLSMFLTADGKPIDGGTYWPREDKTIDGEKYVGFKSILKEMLKRYKDTPDKVEERAEAVASATKRRLRGVPGIALVELDRKLVESVLEGLEEEFDSVHGGFGNSDRRFSGPKFPMPSTLVLLLGEARRTSSKAALKMAEKSLDHMARGGIYDHLGGGFHRYTVERTWTVPHFEKMLYDNAQLLETYAAAYTLTKKPLYARVLRETAEFVKREMTSPEGGFYSALDADSEGEEGRFYVWTAKEFLAALPDRAERDLFARAYGTDKGLNFEGKYHILKLLVSLEELAKERGETPAQLEAKLAPVRKRLFDLRAKRERPFLDTKVLTAWNGQMIAGLARAGQALDDKALVQQAEKAADFVLKNLRTKEGRLLRSWAAVPGEKPQARFNAYLDDYAFLVHGLITLHEVTGAKRWLDEAKTLTTLMQKWHNDEAGGFFTTSSDHEKLFARGKDRYDGAQPGGNSVAISNFVRLWALTGEADYEKEALRSLKGLAAQMRSNSTSLCWATEALALYLEKKTKK